MKRILQRMLVVCALSSLCTIDPAASAGSSSGSVGGEIKIVKGTRTLSEHANVVVYLQNVPDSGTKRKHAIRQKGVQFSPRVSVIVKGTTVEFPNEDKIFHNVFSPSRPARFDLGLYRSGASKSVDFKREGVVDVFCNIHPEMSSRVLVVPSSHFATTDAQGKFRIDGVPPGTYPVVVWHPNGTEVRKTLTVEAGKVAALSTTVDEGERATEHRRKDGTPYGRYE